MAFFDWLVALGKILIMDNLRKQHVIVVDWCLYRRNGESVDHLLLHCDVGCAIWNVFFNIDLGCIGSYLDEWSICMLVDGLLATLGVLLCGR